MGTLRLLDAIRTCGLTHHVRFYQVSHPTCMAPCVNADVAYRLRLLSSTGRLSRLLNLRLRPSILVRLMESPSSTHSGSSRTIVRPSYLTVESSTDFLVYRRGILWNARVERYSVQSRVASTWTNLCHSKDFSSCCRNFSWTTRMVRLFFVPTSGLR